MPMLVIAVGNPLRRDDGVAHSVRIPAGVRRLAVLQLTPELAEQVGRYDTVVFLDADSTATQLSMQPWNAAPAPSPLTHICSPAEIVALARSLFGFSGRAYTCRIPARDFSEGEGISDSARSFAEQAAREIDSLTAFVIE